MAFISRKSPSVSHIFSSHHHHHHHHLHAVVGYRRRRTVPDLLASPLLPVLSAPVRRKMTSSAPSPYKKVLSLDTINQNVKQVEYAVRGELSNRAGKYADQLSQGNGKDSGLPFDSVVTANIGNPQQQPHLAQKPLTFWRQVAALTEYPDLLESPDVGKMFPSDVQDRAKKLLHDVGSVGAYSHSKGCASVRQNVANYIEERDGHATDPEMIYLTAGASAGVQLLLSVVVSGPDVGVMIPIPQYPLYSAALAFNNAKQVRYSLNSHDNWSADVEAMAKQVDEERAKGTDVRAIVVINPGNPTGGCLTLDNIKAIIKMAHEKRLVVMADEVYQANIYLPKEFPFISFRKVLKDFAKSGDAAEKAIADEVELVSFHSISKGVTGECGRRGGYFELTNMSPEVESQIYKMASVNLCPPISGQIGVDMLVRPPREGEASYELWKRETDGIHATLMERSKKMAGKFNELEGISCGEAQGALYLFPSLLLPEGAMKKAKEEQQAPDLYYCLRLLDATGICVVPGSGFGKTPEGNKMYLRTTVLAKETDAFVKRFGDFHSGFVKEFGGLQA